MGRTRDVVVGNESQDGEKSKKEASKPQQPEQSERPKLKKSAPKRAKLKIKGRKYLAAAKLLDTKKVYPLDEAVNMVKKLSYSRFDGTVEIHIKTSAKKGQDFLRGIILLPAGAAKEKNIAVANEAIIEEIKSGKINFDILIATPEMMLKLAPLSKILGQKGLMPNPKSGTITSDPKSAKEEFSRGKVEYKSDPHGNIHLAVGKVSWQAGKIVDNIKAVLAAIPANRVGSVYICATMGPSIHI